MPAPKDPAHLTELTTLGSKLTAAYGSGKYCKDANDAATCRNLDELSKVLADDRDWDHDLDAWTGWHHVGRGMLKDYQRFAQLLNEGARDLGYDNVGTMWRAGYDMSPAEFAKETDRLWSQVQPLYGELQCYARSKLATKYGERMPKDGTIPAHITGNMWAQDWANLYPMLEPYPGVGNLDVNQRLEAQRKATFDELRKKFKGTPTPLDVARSSTRRTEERRADGAALGRFLHVDRLPAAAGIVLREIDAAAPARPRCALPRERVADGHGQDDVRIKMCIQPTEEDQYTIYHEMGHIYYYLAYKDQWPIFQGGANDGFHEAIGDTIRLNITPAYLAEIGLAGKAGTDEKAALNAADEARAREGRVPAVRSPDRQVALGRVRRIDRAGQVQRGVVAAAPQVSGRVLAGRGDAGRFRSRREEPRADERAVHALFPRGHPAVPVLPRAVRGGRPQGSAVPMLDLRQQGSRREILENARRRREPAVAADAEGADRQGRDGRERDHRLFRAAVCVAAGAEQGQEVRVVR